MRLMKYILSLFTLEQFTVLGDTYPECLSVTSHIEPISFPSSSPGMNLNYSFDSTKPRELLTSPVFKYLGKQLLRLENAESIVMTNEKHQEFCTLASQNKHKTLRPLYENKIIFVDERISQSCNGQLGLYTSFKHFPYWCDLGGYIIWTNIQQEEFTFFIGYYYNQHDGNKFKSQRKKYPQLNNCSFFESRVEKDFFKEIEISSMNYRPKFNVCGMPDQNDIFQNYLNNFSLSWRSIIC
eukprot:snap_masked-scaffold_71-processed-gene-0.45-mRNA-1 protein AED:1.00 eAED:1.00 QI:0/0/0/0/1/1/3/0/238